MNTYEQKRQARIERLKNRIERLEKFSEGKDLSLFGEAKSGIPLGQPILVGHHSERRHRRHLERIERIVRSGYDAKAKAQKLREKLFAAESCSAIQSDNPEAESLLSEKLLKLKKRQELDKQVNKLCKKFKTPESLAPELLKLMPETKDPLTLAQNLLTPYLGMVGVPDFTLRNRSAEIRRLEKRIEQQKIIDQGFESFEVGPVLVELYDGQIQIEFPRKPDEKIRDFLKSKAFKWSRYSERWVRKHTASTGSYFRKSLKEGLENFYGKQ